MEKKELYYWKCKNATITKTNKSYIEIIFFQYLGKKIFSSK